MKKKLLILLLIAILIPFNFLSAQVLTKSMWKEDILQLKEYLQTKHVNLYHQTSRSKFDKEFDAVLKKLDALSDEQAITEISRLVALAGDGHTSFFPDFDQKLIKFKSFPICLSLFDDGLYVISAPETMPDIAGLKLVAIDEVKISAIRKKLIPYIPRDNDQEISYTYPEFIENAGLLHALGITKNESQATFVFEKNGMQARKIITALSDDDESKLKWVAARESLRKFASIRNLTFLFANAFTLPQLAKRPSYWAQSIDSSKVVFFQYTSCFDQKGRPTFKEYVNKEVFDFMDTHPGYKLVIDMRYNPGGDPNTAQALMEGIKARPIIFEKNRPVVLVGIRTFSAAATNVLQLKSLCNAVLIGQISRAKPNSPSEGRSFELKNSHCKISISTEMVNRDASLGNAPYIPLDKIIPLNYNDYIKDVDLTFNYALMKKPSISVGKH